MSQETYNLLLALLATLPATLAALAGLIVAWRTSNKVTQVQAQTNGMHAVIVTAERKDARDIERANPTPPDHVPTMETK